MGSNEYFVIIGWAVVMVIFVFVWNRFAKIINEKENELFNDEHYVICARCGEDIDAGGCDCERPTNG